ncbi:hypothetical protein D0962_04270 [Leptolyngbyaceae cyanobacterium CCMR0082]|uniref:Uncharacterized protein n=1 Tax=Adonisia turfae CCMR0082 TaxID=2304604 RepID=A0A6M0S0T2_9CYAN|nr:hypothetical protein [Adonisia turfae]NEZ61996.1 hypothetical protein [Adonisia turfae CCMR0082]
MATNQRKLQLILEIVVRQQKKIAELISQLQALNDAAKNTSSIGGDTKQIDQLIARLKEAEEQLAQLPQQSKQFSDELTKGGRLSAQSVTAIATSFLAIQSAIQGAFSLATQFYQRTIGLSEQLNQQILRNAASIATSSKVVFNGVEQSGVDAIEALKPKLKEVQREIEIATEQIAGVTDEQSRTTADALIGKIVELQGQTKEYANTIDSLPDLTSGLVAALAANNLTDPTQIYQEIGDLAEGQLGPDSSLARALTISKDDIDRAREQNELIDLLIEKTQTYKDASNLAANSISNVSSNFISLTERIARESTEDLLDPIATGLNQVFDLVSENEDRIISEIKIVLDALGGIAVQIGNIISPLGQLADEGESVIGLMLDGFQAIERVLTLIGPVVRASLGVAVEFIEYLANEVDELRTALSFLTGGLQNVDEAIEAYGQATEVAANGTLELLRNLKDAGSQSEETQKLYKDQAQAQIESNNALIQSIRGTVPANEAQRRSLNAQVAELENWNEKLEESQAQLEGVGDGLEILAQDLPAVADSFEAVGERVDSALSNLAEGSGGKLENVARSLKTVQEGISQLFDAGELSGEDAISRLNQAIAAPGLELSQKLSLATEVRKIQKTASDEKLASIDAELKVVQSAADAEGRITAESAIKISNLRQQQLQERLRATQEAISAESRLLEQDAGSQRTLNQLKNQQKTLQAELGAIAVQGQRDIEKARIEEIDRANLDIQALAARTRATIFQEEQALNQERSRNAELTEAQIQARVSRLRAEANKERLQQEIVLQQQRVEVFEEGSRKRREAEIKLGDLRTELAEAGAAVEEASRAAAVAVIDAQIEDEQRLQQLQQQRLEFRQQAEERIIESLQDQRDLFQSQLDLINERNSLAQSLAGAETADAERALQIRQELDNNENLSKAQRKQLEQELTNLGFSRNASERKIAEEILERKKQEIALQAQALQAQQSAERAQLQFQNQLRTLEANRETRREQARLRELEFQRTLLELEAEKADARGDARGAKIAREGVDRTDEAIGQQQQAIAQSQRSEQTVQQINANALQELSAKQARESFEFARNVAQESQQLATELGGINEKVGRRAQRFANQQDDIADGARLDAQETLNALRDASVSTAIEDLTIAQNRANTNIEILTSTNETAQVLEGQLEIEQDLLTVAQQRLEATTALNEALGNPPANQAQTQPIPSLDTGGPLPANQPALIHAGELLVPGAPSRSAAVHAISTGRSIQAVKSDGLYRGPGGYVLNRQDVQQLVQSPTGVPISPTQPVGSGLGAIFGEGSTLDTTELSKQSGLLGELVKLAQNDSNSKRVAARVARHGRYRKG